MHFDFEVLLLVITLAATVIWALDALLWRRARREASGKTPWWVEYGCAFAPILLMVLVLRSFIVEPFRIPSNSMMPTLLTGDFIMVNKFAYGVRLPVLHTKLISVGEPSRGDVAVFRYPLDPSQDYIKRVVGVPGDVVGYRWRRRDCRPSPDSGRRRIWSVGRFSYGSTPTWRMACFSGRVLVGVFVDWRRLISMNYRRVWVIGSVTRACCAAR